VCGEACAGSTPRRTDRRVIISDGPLARAVRTFATSVVLVTLPRGVSLSPVATRVLISSVSRWMLCSVWRVIYEFHEVEW